MATTRNRIDYIVNVIDEGTRELQRLRRAAKRTKGGLDEVDQVTERLRGRTKEAGKEATRTASKLQGLKFAAQAAGGKTGELAGRLENAGGAFGSMSLGAGLAAASVLAATAAVAGMAIGAVKLTRIAGDSAEELRQFGDALSIPAEAFEKVERSNAALDAIGTTAKGLVTVMAAELAPAVEAVATGIVALGLASIDAFNYMAQGVDLGIEALTTLVNLAINPINESLLRMAQAFRLLTGSDALAGFEEWAQDQRVTLGDLGDAFQFVTGDTRDYIEAARELIDVQERVNAGIEATVQKVSTWKTELKDVDVDPLSDVFLDVNDGAGKALKTLDKISVSLADIGSEVNNARTWPDDLAKVESAYGMIAPAIDATAQLVGNLTKDADKSARAVFAIQKAAALARIVVDTAAAVTQGLAIGGPPLAAAYGAIGALQFAAAASATFDSPGSPAGAGSSTAGATAPMGQQPGFIRDIVGGPDGGGMTKNPNGGGVFVVLDHNIFEAGLQRSARNGGAMSAISRIGRSGLNNSANNGA